jgi:hypothetical protein
MVFLKLDAQGQLPSHYHRMKNQIHRFLCVANILDHFTVYPPGGCAPEVHPHRGAVR